MSRSTLRALRQSAPLRAGDGASAELADDGNALAIRSPRGDLLFEYRVDGESGRCTVFAPSGDLELRADAGRIALHGAEGVSLSAPEADIALDSQRLHARAASAELEATDASLSASTLRAAATMMRASYGAVETRADRLIERCRAAYREVEDLSQTRAGRIRTIARDTLQLLGERALIKARDDVKLKGERIHLG